jgi:hypothetical protein
VPPPFGMPPWTVLHRHTSSRTHDKTILCKFDPNMDDLLFFMKN